MPDPIRLPAAPDPEVSIVVLLSREAALAADCLGAVATAVDPALPTEVIVVLNSRDEETRHLAHEGVAGARVVETEANTGIAVGWNLAFDVARGRRCALLHEDSLPQPGWLTRLSATMDEHPLAAVVGARLQFPDGRFQNGGWALWREGVVTKLTPDHAPDLLEATEPYPADSVSSAGLLLDRSAWERTGGFDERFFPSVYTDIDFNTSVWQLGRTVLSEPRALVRHGSLAMIHGAGGALTSLEYHVFLRERHRARFVEKWGAALAADHEPGPPGADANRADAEAVRRARARTAARARRPPQAAADRLAGRASRALSLPVDGRRERLLAAPAVVQAEFADALHEELAATRGRRDAIASDLASVVAHRDAVVVDRDTQIAARGRADAAVADAVGAVSARERELAAAGARISALEAEREVLRERAATLDRILAGGWWRLGAPLRAVRRRAQKR